MKKVRDRDLFGFAVDRVPTGSRLRPDLSKVESRVGRTHQFERRAKFVAAVCRGGADTHCAAAQG